MTPDKENKLLEQEYREVLLKIARRIDISNPESIETGRLCELIDEHDSKAPREKGPIDDDDLDMLEKTCFETALAGDRKMRRFMLRGLRRKQ